MERSLLISPRTPVLTPSHNPQPPRDDAAAVVPAEASAKNYRELFEDAPIGMAVVALDEQFLQVNASFCQMVGYSAEELLTRTAEDITLHEDVEIGRQLAKSLLEGTPRYTGDKRYVHKSGRVLWVSRTARLMRDAAGQPQHFLLMVEDISERKQNERALQESRREFEAALHANQLIMDNSQDVICTLSAEGRFLTVSAACEQLWGYAPSELFGQDHAQFVHPDDRAKSREIIQTLMAVGKISGFVNRYVRKDGAIVDVLWSAAWSAADGMMFCVAHDVTERARIEKALVEAKDEADRANHAKSEFLSRMSHELRTPLNAILGFGQLLERQNPTEAQRSRIRYILTAGRHLLSLINEVLDISRIEAGSLQLSLEPVSVGEAITEAIDLMRPLAGERAIEISLPVLVGTAFVMADRQRFKQVLLNLLTNAVKYTPTQGNIHLTCVSTGDATVRVIVTDTGAGIAADKLPRLFTPFDRLGAEQSNVEGTGLGLALCQRLMHAMNGTIGVESDVGSGSNFWVELPHAESPFKRLPSSPAAFEIQAGFSGKKRRVLYIEDNFSNVTLVEQMLAEQPAIELITAIQGRVGLELARQHRLDLILLDLHLPDVPGWEVLARLKAEEATRGVPVVVISADATPRQIEKLLAAGAHTYLTKPLDFTEFSRVVEESIACAPGDKMVAA